MIHAVLPSATHIRPVFRVSKACALTLLLLLSGCASTSSVPCSAESISPSCILGTANAVVRSMPAGFERVSAGSELAVAYASTNQPRTAENLIDGALIDSSTITDDKQRNAALLEIVAAIIELPRTSAFSRWSTLLKRQSASLFPADRNKLRADTLVAEAIHGNARRALERAIALPQQADLDANSKAIALRNLSTVMAEHGDFEAARRGVNAVTMSSVYYQSLVRSDVARHAHRAGQSQLAQALLTEADTIARGLTNGYFSGAALRDIGLGYAVMGDTAAAERYFANAAAATSTARSAQERARATSRIATRLADADMADRSRPLLDSAVKFAADIDSPTMLGYAWYEIAGSAAFSGEFELARTVLEKVPDMQLGSTASLRAAADRDLAWGLARNGQVGEALTIANGIAKNREQVQALSRIVRLLETPRMVALPRYP